MAQDGDSACQTTLLAEMLLEASLAQLLLVPVGQARLRVVDAFAPSARGAGGFGSTGVS